MAALDELIQQIQDPTLRERIQQEVDKVTKQKKFGLVFEEHLPECTPLYDMPIYKGTKVARKDDNLGKAQGLAEFARQNQAIGRIQLIRKGKNGAGKDVFVRLDLSKGEIRDMVIKATSNDELDHIFDLKGISQ